MIVILDTSTPVCYLTLIFNEETKRYDWQSDRGLAKGILSFIEKKLDENNLNWQDISGLVVYKGPGSFTGLRIGITVMNTLASSLGVPIIGENGDLWEQLGVSRLNNHEDDRIVLPIYGREANITEQKK